MMAIVRKSDEIRADRETGPGYRGVISRILAGNAQGLSGVTVRLLSVKEGGRIPRRDYQFRRTVFILQGELDFMDGDGALHRVGQGDVLLISPWERHHFQNDSCSLARIIIVETVGE
jgi:quercetin dioxygenase-like cupin family protein